MIVNTLTEAASFVLLSYEMFSIPLRGFIEIYLLLTRSLVYFHGGIRVQFLVMLLRCHSSEGPIATKFHHLSAQRIPEIVTY